MTRKRLAATVLIALLLAGAAWRLGLPQRLGWTAARPEAAVLYGNVDIRQVALGFRVGGRILAAAAEEGEAVRTGDLLARLDPQPQQQAVAEAEARAAGLAAVLRKLEAGPRAAEIAQARATHEANLADLRNAELIHGRTGRLQPEGAVSKASLDQATAARDMARARAAAAGEALRLLEDGTRPEDIDAARADLRAAEASLAAARTALADTELRAPSDGVVLARAREPGAIVAPGDAVLTLALTDQVWVRAYVAEPDLGRFPPGLAVEVTNDTEPGRVHRGRIGFVSPVAEFTPKAVETPDLRTDLVYRLRVIIDAPDPSLRQGMPVTVRLPAVPTTPAR